MTDTRERLALDFVYRPCRAWASVSILILFSLLSTLDRQTISLQVDPIRHSLGLTDTQLGLLQGLAFALLYALAGLPLGWAVDRLPRRILLHIGITFWSLSAASTGLARNFWQMFIARTSVGVGEAVLAPSALSLISDMFPRDRVATPLGIYSSAFYLGVGASLAIGGVAIHVLSGSPYLSVPLVGQLAPWQAVFIITGLPGVFLGLLAYCIFDPNPSRIHVTPASTLGGAGLWDFCASNWRTLLLAFLGFGMTGFVAYAISAWTPTYFIRVHHFSPLRIGATYGGIMALAAPGAALGGFFTDLLFRKGYRNSNFLVAGVATLCSAPFLVGAFLLPNPNGALAALAAGMMLYGFTAPGPYSTFQRLAPANVRGRIMASFVLFNALVGAGLAPLAVGIVTDHVYHDPNAVGSSLAWVLGIALPLTAALLFVGRSAARTEGVRGRRAVSR